MFIGRVPELPLGFWVGIKYDEPVGKNDGSVKGVRYFEWQTLNRSLPSDFIWQIYQDNNFWDFFFLCQVSGQLWRVSAPRPLCRGPHELPRPVTGGKRHKFWKVPFLWPYTVIILAHWRSRCSFLHNGGSGHPLQNRWGGLDHGSVADARRPLERSLAAQAQNSQKSAHCGFPGEMY